MTSSGRQVALIRPWLVAFNPDLLSTKVSERVYLLDTLALGQPGTVGAYVIKGPKPTLVDCGYASSYETVLAGLAEVGVSPSDVRYLIPTHVHLDHAGAAGHLIARMPRAEVIAHERAVPHIVDPTRLIESATKVFGREIMELYGSPQGIEPGRVTSVDKETALDLGDGLSATLTHSPGHAPHQLSISLDGTGTLLTADAVGIVYPGMKSLIPTTPPPSLDPPELISTVGRLEQMSPAKLLVPHFGIRSDVGRVFDETKTKVKEWVDWIRKMRNEGKTFDEMTEVMVGEVAREEGLEEIPIFARVSVRTSVMGINHFLEKNA
jgi:glyoxylase-like metal-dependent hydrolase (beta-lactamase superfamily II)